MSGTLQAILFDCDGVLAETERDGHRIAYNKAFEAKGLDIRWDALIYSDLVRISGGKERMRHYFEQNSGHLAEDHFNEALIQELYQIKTEYFKDILRRGILPCREGISRIIAQAHSDSTLLFVCSTSHKESVETLIASNMGQEYLGYFTDLLCGDIVPHKKPAADIYLLAKEKYGLNPKKCVVIEDSRNGLLAAKGAGMNCLVTPSFYTQNEDFSEADAIISTLGDDTTPAKLIRVPTAWKNISRIGAKDLNRIISKPT